MCTCTGCHLLKVMIVKMSIFHVLEKVKFDKVTYNSWNDNKNIEGQFPAICLFSELSLPNDDLFISYSMIYCVHNLVHVSAIFLILI